MIERLKYPERVDGEPQFFHFVEVYPKEVRILHVMGCPQNDIECPISQEIIHSDLKASNLVPREYIVRGDKSPFTWQTTIRGKALSKKQLAKENERFVITTLHI